MLPASAASCENHPEREALGICVRCRKRICSECVTKIDGINYCVACLAELGGAEAPAEDGPRPIGSRLLAGASVAGWFVLLVVLTWGLVEVALPGG